MAERGGTPPNSRRVYFWGIGGLSEPSLGQARFTTAPLNRKKTPTKAQQYARGTMTVAARFTKDILPAEYNWSVQIAQGSGFTWKDVFVASLYGTLFEVTEEDGTVWIGRRILVAEIQQLLDSICSDPGAILVRTDNGWACLLKGAPGYAMVIDPATEMPNWLPPAAAPSGSDALAVATGATPGVDFTGGATIAQAFINYADIQLKSIRWTAQPPISPATYRCFAATLDASGKILAVAALSPDTWTTSGTGHQAFTFTFPSAPVLVKNQLYGLCLVITNSTTSQSTRHWQINANYSLPGWPMDYAALYLAYSSFARKFYYNSNVINPSNVSPASNAGNNALAEIRFSV